MTAALKLAAATGVVGLIGGVVAERLLSPDSIAKSREADAWNARHDDFIKDNPVPAGTRESVFSTPAWKNAALAGGAAAGVGLLGGGALFYANRINNFPLGVAGLAAATLGAGAIAGVAGSWFARGLFD